MIGTSDYYDNVYTDRYVNGTMGASLAFWKDHFTTQTARRRCQHGHWIDLGCGCGAVDWYFVSENPVQVTAVDFSPVALQYARALPAREGLRWVYSNILDLQFDTATFDGCLCSHTLEHIENTDQLLSEAVRVTRPGGTLVIIVPHSHYADDPSHCQHFTIDQLSALLSPWGETELELTPCGNHIVAIVHLPEGKTDATETA